MRCYVPRIGTILLIIVAGAGVLHGPAGHAVATVGLITAALMSTALVVGILTGMLFAARAVQRRRGAAGACTTCRFSCQQSLTRHGARPAGRRPLLVGIYTRENPKPRWPRQPIPLTTFLNWPPEGDTTATPAPATAERVPERSAAGSGDLGAGAAEHQDRARPDGDLVPS